MKDVRELTAADAALETAARSARCAAFATAAACIAATQEKEALFANPLKMPGKANDPAGECKPGVCLFGLLSGPPIMFYAPASLLMGKGRRVGHTWKGWALICVYVSDTLPCFEHVHLKHIVEVASVVLNCCF